VCLQFYYKDIGAVELELTEAERTERTKKLVMLRKKKMRESRPTTTEAGGGEAAIHIRGAGLQGPTSPGGTPQEASEPAPGEAEVTGIEVDRTVSAELYHSLLSNPKLTDEQRQAVVEMQAKRTADEAAPDEDPGASGELQQWLSRTPSRQDLARNRRELEILQALGPEPADAVLVRTPSATSQADTAEVARLEEAGTQAEIARVAAEVAKLKEELGLV
jgi:cell division protein FtsN